jgi:hypothetical protein
MGINRQMADFNRTFLNPHGSQDAQCTIEIVLDNVSLIRLDAQMHSKFDIFKRLRNGTSISIAAVEGLEEARNRINRLAIVGPGDYLICSEERGLVVERAIR